MSAFQIAQPRPRDHVARSTPSPERNASRLAPSNSVQAITTSHAGSPTAPPDPRATPPGPPPPKPRPADHAAAAGAAAARAPEVDPRREPAVAQQEVAGRDVAVDPDRRTVARGGQRVVEHPPHGTGGD